MDIKAKEIILDIVQNNVGIRGTFLVVEVITRYYEKLSVGQPVSERKEIDFVEIINTLVKERELVELEYVLPSMDYRVKSMYFPKGTALTIVS